MSMRKKINDIVYMVYHLGMNKDISRLQIRNTLVENADSLKEIRVVLSKIPIELKDVFATFTTLLEEMDQEKREAQERSAYLNEIKNYVKDSVDKNIIKSSDKDYKDNFSTDEDDEDYIKFIDRL